ncbi:hypothetical protein CPB84DRAFT_1797683 [Gymnopilus junonius]|uniref:Uncharacterized protein n=1 Tax=Gymnopilus junonius TaxID=109634 RepID=A0A9P5NAM0_GYMJU|nr:hypothetical protein CPB84DRAFT_1797683 [Gymnopilus junonius]
MPQAIVLPNDEFMKTDESLIGLEQEPAAVVGSKKSSVFDFLYQRSTYYWTTLLISFCQIGLCTLGFALAIAHNELSFESKKRGYSGDIFIVAGICSVFLLIFNVANLYYHYKKGSDTGPRAYNAGKHFGTTLCAVLTNFMALYMIFLLGPVFSSEVEPCTDNIRPVLYQLIVGFNLMSIFSNIAAAYITSKSTKRARGAEMVPDPNYRVPAWTLATTEESQRIAGQAAADVDPKKFSVFDFLYWRSTYYWATIFINFCQVGFCTAGLALAIARKEWNSNDKKGYSGGVFMVPGVYSICFFMFSAPVLYYHYKKGSDTGPKAFNAGRHFVTTICAVAINISFILSLLLTLALNLSFGDKTEPCTDNIRPALYHLMAGFTIVGTFSNIMAARITLKSAKRARGAEMVPDPNYRVPAWTLATTEESQGLLGGAIRL